MNDDQPSLPIDPALMQRASELLSEAVMDLAIGPGDVRSRLIVAAGPLRMVPAEGLPQDLRAEWESIVTDLSSRERTSPYESEVGHTVSRMKNKTGAKIAEQIVSLHAKLEILIGNIN